MQMTRITRMTRWTTVTVAVLSLGVALVVTGFSQTAQAQPSPGDGSGEVTTVTVSGGSQTLLKIALPALAGDSTVSSTVNGTSSRDFTLSSLFQVLNPQSFTANLAAEGAGIDPASWRNVGADGVVKGLATKVGSNVHLELSLFVVSRGSTPVLKESYDVQDGGVRAATHKFDNEVVKYFTGRAGSFGTRLVYSATVGSGQKGIFAIDRDGQGGGRLNAVSNVALAPTFGPGGIYYAAGTPDGAYKLYKVGSQAPAVTEPGLIFGGAFGAGKLALVISTNGVSDIWQGSPDGSGMSKVTNGGLNTHPAYGPGGQLAYVSSQGGSPQIYVDGKRVSWRGSYNMAPVWCNDPEGTKILYMGRDGANWDVFSVDPGGGAASTKRLTQDQGSNTYPACSPDGRTVAFFSSRGGLFTSNLAGQNQQKIAGVSGESLRWEGN
jgi:TolB protein